MEHIAWIADNENVISVQQDQKSSAETIHRLIADRSRAKKMSFKSHVAHAVTTRRVIVVSSTFLCLFVADLGVRRLGSTLQRYDNRYKPGELYRKLKEIDNLALADVILMGSSRAMFAFVPEEFENATQRSAFNIGISASLTAGWQIFARRLLAHHRPRLIVLGVNAGAFRHDYLPTKAGYFLFDWHDLIGSCRREGPSLQGIGWYVRHRFGHIWTVFAQRRELKLLGQEKLSRLFPKYAQFSREQRTRVAQSSQPDGYEPYSTLVGNAPTLQQVLDNGGKVYIRQPDVPQFDPLASPFGRLGDLLTMIRDHGVNVLVAYLPNSPRVESRWSAVEPKIKNRISAICREHGVSFLPCGMDQLTRTNRDFVDEIHVTESFGRRISRYLAHRIKEKHLLDIPEATLAQLKDPSTGP